MREREIFFEVLDLPTPELRAAYLQGACGGDVTLRRRVDELLKDHFSVDSLLSGPAVRSNRTGNGEPCEPETPSQTIGRYKLLEMIGEGGFGEVWMAEQREPVKRRVALKIIKLGMDTRHIVARFEAERQALAMMNHANIARVFDAGATEAGRLYFVMELVRGVKITEYCDKNALPTHERLKLFILVCRAIQHAHQKGIIHRDIKPSNILVTLHDGVPVPKVIDFGIAKATQGELTDKTVFTQFQMFIGTPAYISPEQAEMSGLDVDTRSDIYSLGVLLYELLVGQTPFDAADMMKGGLDALRQIIREREPAKPSTKLKTLPAVEQTTTAQRRQTDPLRLTHLLRGDLDWIVMKCLEKDRTRRYETANGLASDIQRYLSNEPVVARPPSRAYKIRKTWQRNKLAFTVAALVTLILLFGVTAVILVQHRANEDYRQRLYVSEIGRAGIAWQAGQSSQMRVLLDRCPSALRNWEWSFLRQQVERWESTPVLATSNLVGAALSADGHLLAAAVGERIQIREFPVGQGLPDIPFQAAWHSPFVLSPRDPLLAALDGQNGIITIWKMRTGERVAEMKHGAPAQALNWSSDGQRLASGGSDGLIRIWDAKSGQEQRSLLASATVLAVAFSPDDQTIAVGTEGKDTQLLDGATGAVTRTLRIQGGHVHRLKFSPDGRKLALSNRTFGGYGRDNRVWSLEEEGSLDLSSGADSLAFDFSSDSRQLFVADATGMIRLWDLDRRVEVERFSAHEGVVSSIKLLDRRILSAGGDGMIKIWQPRPPSVVDLEGYPASLRTLAFSPDSRWLVSAGLDRRVFVWDVRGGHRSGVYSNHLDGATAVAISPDGRVATASHGRMDPAVHVWNPATRETVWNTSLAPATGAFWLAYSPDGRRLYAASQTDTVTALDAATGQRLNTITGLENVVDGLAVSPDGRLLAICHKVKLSVWFADGSRELWQTAANPERCAAFSPDGKWIATGDKDGAVSLWEVASAGRVRHRLRGHAASVSGVGFHPDGSRLVSCGFDGQVKVWDWKAGAELLTLPLPGHGMAWHAIFSPDGKTIAAAGGNGIVTLWKVE